MPHTLKVKTFDIETNGLLPEVDTVWCIVVKDHDTGARRAYGPDCIPDGLRDLLDADVLIGHNILYYDLPVLRKIYGFKSSAKKVDTLWLSRFQRPNRKAPPNCPNKKNPHSVEAWGYRLGYKKVENDVWHEYSPLILERCETDVEIQFQIYEELLKEGKGEGWGPSHRMNMRLFDLLQRQEEKGWMVDVAHMDRCINQLNSWIVRIDSRLDKYLPLVVEPQETKKDGEYGYIKKPFVKSGAYAKATIEYYGSDVDYVGGPFSRVSFRRLDLNSNAETKEFLLNSGWEPLEWNTNKDGEQTSPKLSKDDPFVGVSGKLGKLLVKRVKCRHRLGTLEGLRAVVREDGTIAGGVSGMASTGRMKHHTIVNIPSIDSGAFYARQMRSCFIARPGFVMVGADSKGNQIRQLAARMDDEEFTHAVLHGTKENDDDLHSINRKRSGVKTRTEAKNFFYGFIFGAQDAKIGKIIGGSKADGKRLRETYLSEVPKLKLLIDDLTGSWRASAKKWYSEKWHKWEAHDGYIKGLDGRPILVDSEHKVLNYALQSDEAIQLAYAYILIHDWMEERGYREFEHWNMLCWYHDEFQCETLPGLADEVGHLMCEAIKQAGLYFNIKCPHDGDYKVGNNWAETH